MAKRIIGLIIFISIVLIEAQAEIYKWKDDKGKIHYGDKPIASSEKMNIKEGSASRKNINQSSRNDRRRKLMETYDLERKEKKQQQAKRKEKRKKLNAQCGGAKDSLRRYKRAGRIYDLDKDGNRIYLSDAAHESAVDNLQKQIKKHCS